jgi:hypothetical protein
MSRQYFLSGKNVPEEVKLFCIFERKGVWEGDWSLVQRFGSKELLSRFTVLSIKDRSAYTDSLRGHGGPLWSLLGRPPHACMMGLPKSYLECGKKNVCGTYDKKNCMADRPLPPFCYSSNITSPHCSEDELMRLQQIVSELFDLWRHGIYVLVIPEH